MRKDLFLLAALGMACHGKRPDGLAETRTTSAELDPSSARELRRRLIDVVALEVSDPRVLDAMRTIPRHRFVPDAHLGVAYADRPVPIGNGQTISQPSLVGLMSQSLELGGHERVLEIGTGSGYQTAVLSRLAGQVDSVEIVPSLSARSARILAELGCDNVRVHVGDGWKGWPPGAPYDRIVVTAAPEALPGALVEQLAEGGLLVVPVGGQEGDQRLLRYWKKEGNLHREDLGAVRFVPMVHGD